MHGPDRTLGNSRFNTNGAEWETRRDLTKGSINSRSSAKRSEDLRDIQTLRFTACDTTPEAVQRALMLASSEIFFAALNCEVAVDGLHRLFEHARHYVKRLQYCSWNPCSASDSRALIEEADQLACEFEAEVQKSSELGALMVTFRERAGALHDFNPLDELMMNFFAGLETTAATLDLPSTAWVSIPGLSNACTTRSMRAEASLTSIASFRKRCAIFRRSRSS